MPFLDALHAVAARRDLSGEQAEQAMMDVLCGDASAPQVAAFLVALKMKGETVEEVAGFARAMRARAAKVPVEGVPGPVLDTCGTGGDGLGTFNISTVAAFVVAGAGVGVAKHGNRSISSRCGSADVLEALGVRIDLTAEQMGACLRKAGIAFLFAPALHPAMKHAQPARLELKMRTVFNLLGPLTNPAGANVQLIGAPSEEAAGLMARALARLPVERALVVHGSDGLDEITTTGATAAFEVFGAADGRPSGPTVSRRVLQPADFGLPPARLEDLAGAGKEENAAIARAILAGEIGPRRDVVVANAGAALWLAGKAATLLEGARLAAGAIDSGAARRSLEGLVRCTAALAGAPAR